MRRVVITGRGCISGLGVGAEALENAVREGACGFRPIHSEHGPLTMKIGCPVYQYDPAEHFDSRRLRELDLFSQFAIVAVREALAQAKLPTVEASACILGTGMGGQSTYDETCHRLYALGRAPNPLTVPRAMVSSAASQVSMEFGIKGPTFSVSSACASASHAIGLAFQMIRHSLVDVAVAGGSEICFTYSHLRSWDSLRVVSGDTCRPFCQDRSGLILGEGAGALILESLDHAKDRGVPILAEVAGFGQCSDAGDLTAPSVDGMAEAITLALKDAQLAPNQIQHVNAHGTGTKANDAAESQALRRVMGEHLQQITVTASKSIHGHGLGASAAFEAIATILALREGIAPPTANITELDPACNLDIVHGQARKQKIKAALSNSFGFGGVNAVLALKAWGPNS